MFLSRSANIKHLPPVSRTSVSVGELTFFLVDKLLTSGIAMTQFFQLHKTQNSTQHGITRAVTGLLNFLKC